MIGRSDTADRTFYVRTRISVHSWLRAVCLRACTACVQVMYAFIVGNVVAGWLAVVVVVVVVDVVVVVVVSSAT